MLAPIDLVVEFDPSSLFARVFVFAVITFDTAGPSTQSQRSTFYLKRADSFLLLCLDVSEMDISHVDTDFFARRANVFFHRLSRGD